MIMPDEAVAPEAGPPEVRPGFAELVRVFGGIGLVNFGGPAGQIALMHRVLVEERRWISEARYLQALNFCTLLPGPEAQQLATYVGWRLHGVRGGLAAGGLFVIPGALVMLALSALYAYAANLSLVAAALLGVKAAVLAIVVEALLRISRRALDAPLKWALAGAAFLALFVFQAPFPLVLVAAAAIGLTAAAFHPDLLRLAPAPADSVPKALDWGLVIRTAGLWLAIWAAPLAIVLVVLGPDHILFQIGLFFSKLAVLTFGGAYAVLAYMAQAVVGDLHWLAPHEMVDSLGLAETTPGPLILVTQFVAFLAGFRHAAPFTPFVAGVLASAVALWVTFAPCFLWIFVGAPFIERLEHDRPLRGALAAITAAVVGVIANLTLWFSLHVLFTRFDGAWLGVTLPSLQSLDLRALGLGIVAALALFRFHLGVVKTIGLCAALGLGLHFLL